MKEKGFPISFPYCNPSFYPGLTICDFFEHIISLFASLNDICLANSGIGVIPSHPALQFCIYLNYLHVDNCPFQNNAIQ